VTNLTNKQGGYKSLLVYWLAVDIYDFTVKFCQIYIDKRSRTVDQMVQAARSGKQNIVEGSLENSTESNIKLTGVARASFGELLEDYKDYLRQNNLRLWEKDSLEILKLRKLKLETNESNKSYETYKSYLTNPESFCNLLITLCFKEGYLLDKLLISQQSRFVSEGGFREKLFKSRIEYKSKNIIR
jgi:four helix bundle suffix protein